MTLLNFSTKAGTLAALQGVLKTARIAPLRAFSVADWQADRQACLGSRAGDRLLRGGAAWR